MTESEQETLKHIRRVQELLGDVAARIVERARVHDVSKLQEPEASIFETYTAKLKGSTYGSPEYKQFLAEMKPALDHHYANNAHHPEHWTNGIKDMSLLDLIEMFVDWKAATERHADGSLIRSIEVNKQRFGYGDELERIFLRTAIELFPPTFKPEEWSCIGCGAGGCTYNFCYQCGAGKDDFKAKATA